MLWLDPIPVGLRATAIARLDGGEVDEFLGTAPNDYGLDLAFMNSGELRKRGIYEQALVTAWCGCRVNNRRWSMSDCEFFFGLADRDRLRAAGDPLPGPGPSTLYRGVAGRGSARRVGSGLL